VSNRSPLPDRFAGRSGAWADTIAPMQRDVFSRLELDVTSPATLVLSVAVSQTDAVETLTVSTDGTPVRPRELASDHGARLHVVDAQPGRMSVAYDARVLGHLPVDDDDEADRLRFLRPSRYCESDTLGPTARAEFAGLAGLDLLGAVSSWVGTRLTYVPGASLPTDGAVRTLLARQGVCRDYAHLVVALLRALDVPARLVAVYAPGLDPMDFHAVAEAWVDGAWHVVDATTLAPRGTLVRISTGRDASDTAFLSVFGGFVDLVDVTVGAVADVLPDDDIRRRVRLG
jgi:transglutaminase-like putative cysteine protease